MQYNVQWLDVTNNLATGVQPIYMFKRQLLHGTEPKGGVFNVAQVACRGEFWIPQGNLLRGCPVQFAHTKQGEWVRIPMFDYPSQVRSVADVFRVGIQLGVELASRAIQQIQTRTNRVVDHTVMILGHDKTDINLLDGTPAFRCYAGLALAVDS
jgi:hypothetical protein